MKRFGDEHVIPLALGGNLVLKEAACRQCEKIINQEIESPVLLKEWIYFRIKRNFPTRGKSKKRPTHVSLQTRNGDELRIPVHDYSTPVPLYKFIEPRILSGTERTNDNKHWTMDILTDADAEAEMRCKYPQWNGAHALIPQPFRFARLLAKIAHCRAVSEYGLDGFTPTVLDVILGRSDDYFYTVGGSLETQPAVSGGDHVLDLSVLFRTSRLAFLIADIRLFSQIVTPTYKVVVGKIYIDNPCHASVLKQASPRWQVNCTSEDGGNTVNEGMKPNKGAAPTVSARENGMPIPDWFREEHADKSIERLAPEREDVLSELEALERGIDGGWNESVVQEFLKERRYLLVGRFRSGHGTYAFPELSFGGRYCADWLIASSHSGGFVWELIELESPQAHPFRHDGHFGEATRKGINQIQDWRNWLRRNLDSAERPRSQQGLGLHDISPESPGIVVVGRSKAYAGDSGHEAYNRNRKTTDEQNRIRIESYDSFIESLRFRYNKPPYR
jgi:hypothetical protein